MNRVIRLNNLEDVIEEGYFSKLDSLVAGRSWPPRLANQRISDVNREAEGVVISIEQFKIWTHRIYEAINTGEVITVSKNYSFIYC